jgi:hypothetical protein
MVWVTWVSNPTSTHYVVITGIDQKANDYIINDPEAGRHEDPQAKADHAGTLFFRSYGDYPHVPGTRYRLSAVITGLH